MLQHTVDVLSDLSRQVRRSLIERGGEHGGRRVPDNMCLSPLLPPLLLPLLCLLSRRLCLSRRRLMMGLF